MTKSISRCGKSFANLQAAVTASLESKAPILASCTDSPNFPIKRDDSLSYQLHCVSSAFSNESDSMQTAAIGKIAFAQLPANVSNSSCSPSIVPQPHCYGFGKCFAKLTIWLEAFKAMFTAWLRTELNMAYHADKYPLYPHRHYPVDVEWYEDMWELDSFLPIGSIS